MYVLSRGSQVQYVSLWDAPPTEQESAPGSLQFFEGDAYQPSFAKATGRGSIPRFNTVLGLSQHVTQSTLPAGSHPKRRFCFFFNGGGFELMRILAVPQKIELMLPQIFQVGSRKKHHQAFDSPLWFRCSIVISVSGRLRCPLLILLEQNAHQEVSAMGMETCCTLGLLNAEQAKELKNAGLTELQLR